MSSHIIIYYETSIHQQVIPSGTDLSQSNPGTLISGSDSMCFLFLLVVVEEAVPVVGAGRREGMLRASGIALSLSYLSFSDLRRSVQQHCFSWQ